MSDELVERLRNYDEFEQDRDGQIICQKCEITHEAADRIEQLERELSISRMAQVVMDNGAEALTAERDKYESAWMTAEGKLADVEAERDRLREALTELLEVSRRAVRLSVEHDNFKLYAMEPMERAILLSRYALKGETP